MTEYLVFTLYGPLASWGELAMGNHRHTAMYPTRSALLGILGAACGVDRGDEVGQQRLADGYRFGLRVRSFGHPLRDYHTVQYGLPARRQVFRTRRDELEHGKGRGTYLSTREYRTDALTVVAVEALDNAPFNHHELADQLRHPHFVLYLGRKSAPLALPLNPVVTLAESLHAATESRKEPEVVSWERIVGDETDTYFWEDGMEPGVVALESRWRYDHPVSRDRWQFVRRREHRGGAEATHD